MKTNALSYHLAFALIQLIKHADEGLYQRLNLTVIIQGCVGAMDPKAKGLDEVDDIISLLRESYEPEMDLSPYTYTKRIAFEIELDKSQATLLRVINENQLVSQNVMQEVIASRFDEGKAKRLDKKIHA